MNEQQTIWRRIWPALALAGGFLTILMLALAYTSPVTAAAQATEINLGLAAYAVGEGDGALVVTATLTPSSTEPITVTFSTANLDALAPIDYTGLRRRLTISPGTGIFTTAIPIVDDALVEEDETFEIGLSIAQSATLGSQYTATVTILDNDEALLQVDDVAVWEDAGSAVVTVTQSTTSTLQTFVNAFTADDTALAGEDYVAIPYSTVLNIPPGARVVTLEIPLIDDDLTEGDRQFTVNLADPLNAGLARSSATVTVLDEDGLPVLSMGDATAMESDGAIQFTLALTQPTEMTVEVNYVTVDDTAVAPVDYAFTAGKVTIPTGTMTATITVPLVDDTSPEADERFFLILTDPVAATLTTNEATGIIQDDDDGETGFRLYLPGLVAE